MPATVLAALRTICVPSCARMPLSIPSYELVVAGQSGSATTTCPSDKLCPFPTNLEKNSKVSSC